MRATTLLLLVAAAAGFHLPHAVPARSVRALRGGSVKAVEITKGVEFDTVAREWRMKWSPENDKKSLQEAQAVLDATLAEVKALPGVNSVQRIVCGGCLDFKVMVTQPLEGYGPWEEAGHPPEADFIAKLKAIPGVSQVETQTITNMVL